MIFLGTKIFAQTKDADRITVSEGVEFSNFVNNTHIAQNVWKPCGQWRQPNNDEQKNLLLAWNDTCIFQQISVSRNGLQAHECRPKRKMSNEE